MRARATLPQAPRILILSASIGEGHDGPARSLTQGICSKQPGAEVRTVDFLEVGGPLLRQVLMRGSSFHSPLGSRLFDFEWRMVMRVKPLNRFAKAMLFLLSHRRILRLIEASRPDLIVSTYPGATEVLGKLRESGRVSVPVVSAVTDLAALDFWSHPSVDVHLITHPESAEEVRSIAPASEIVCVRGLTSPGFDQACDAASARRSLDLPASGPIVVVSGGGWAVGDLEGAAEAALAAGVAAVVCLAGRNDSVRDGLQRRFEAEPRVRVMGFTERISDLFAAADVLVHSTAGLTVLEALMRGCRVISYGWGHGHIRVNNEAFVRYGLAQTASSPAELATALKRAMGMPRAPDYSFLELPPADDEVLGLIAAG